MPICGLGNWELVYFVGPTFPADSGLWGPATGILWWLLNVFVSCVLAPPLNCSQSCGLLSLSYVPGLEAPLLFSGRLSLPADVTRVIGGRAGGGVVLDGGSGGARSGGLYSGYR
jgi:hypothetical protein